MDFEVIRRSIEEMYFCKFCFSSYYAARWYIFFDIMLKSLVEVGNMLFFPSFWFSIFRDDLLITICWVNDTFSKLNFHFLCTNPNNIQARPKVELFIFLYSSKIDIDLQVIPSSLLVNYSRNTCHLDTILFNERMDSSFGSIDWWWKNVFFLSRSLSLSFYSFRITVDKEEEEEERKKKRLVIN